MSEPPTRIDYATPYPPRRRPIIWIVLVVLLVLLLLPMAGMVLYLLRSQPVQIVVTATTVPATATVPATPPPVASPPRIIVAPTVPSRVTIIQRHVQPLEGSGGTVIADIGDITHGQTVLSVYDMNGQSLLSMRSVREGQIERFKVGPVAFDIEVIELRNSLTSEDYGVFEIRAAGSPPATRPAPPASAPG